MGQDRDQPLGVERAGQHLRCKPQEPPRGGEAERLAPAVVRHDAPTVEGRRHLPRQGAVRADQSRSHAPLRRLPQAERDGRRLRLRVRRLEERDAPERVVQPFEARPLLAPLVGHRRGAERERHDAIPRGVRRRHRGEPLGYVRGGRFPPPPQRGRGGIADDPPAEAGTAPPFGQAAPDVRRHVAVEAGQEDGALRQPCDGLHQPRRRPTRAGGARDEDGMRAAPRPIAARAGPRGGPAAPRRSARHRPRRTARPRAAPPATRAQWPDCAPMSRVATVSGVTRSSNISAMRSARLSASG
jgi:hypothetical protein